MAITITRAQRDALYEEVLTDLTGVGDIYHVLNGGHPDGARRMWRRFDAEFRLLDEIGWERDDGRERFVIDLPADVLVMVLGDLQQRAEETLGEHVILPREGTDLAQRALDVLGACRGALREFAEQPGARP
jgi:hypothetical protein